MCYCSQAAEGKEETCALNKSDFKRIENFVDFTPKIWHSSRIWV